MSTPGSGCSSLPALGLFGPVVPPAQASVQAIITQVIQVAPEAEAGPALGSASCAVCGWLLLLENFGYGRELAQGGLQVFHDLAGNYVRR